MWSTFAVSKITWPAMGATTVRSGSYFLQQQSQQCLGATYHSNMVCLLLPWRVEQPHIYYVYPFHYLDHKSILFQSHVPISIMNWECCSLFVPVFEVMHAYDHIEYKLYGPRRIQHVKGLTHVTSCIRTLQEELAVHIRLDTARIEAKILI